MKSTTAGGWTFGVVLLALLLVPRAPASDFSVRLQRADALRSSDPQAFGAQLDALEQDASHATPAERRYLRLLRDYRSVIAGDYGAATGDAVALYDQAHERDIKYRAALLVATTSAITRDFSIGLRYLERALQMEDEVDTPALHRAASTVAASVYNQFGQYELARHYARIVLQDRPLPRTRCFARQTLAEALHGLGAGLDEAEDINNAISDCVAQKELIPANLIRSTLAQRWAKAGKLDQAVALLEASLPEVRSTGYTRLIGEFEGLLAQYRLQQGHEAAAKAYATDVARIEGQDPRWLPNVIAHRVLYDIARRHGDYRTALAEYRLYAEADKARLDDIKAREYAFQLSRHELNQKNQSIALLKSQNQLLRLQQQAARASAWNTRLAMALLLVLVASLAYWVWRARRTHTSLRTLADTDGLTGLANRRHFRARSEAALALCAQRKRPVSLLLFDLDHFKQINDQCGHSSGDWVLREVARVGRLHCRESDLFGRIGGEEFAMTLIDCDVDGALRIAEACRRAIASIDAIAAGCGLPVAASIGVAASSVSGYDYESLIAHADAAMYRSKVAGRNRATLYEPPPVPQAGHPPVQLDRRSAEAMLKQY